MDKGVIARIFRHGFADYLTHYGPAAPEQYQAANAIMSCRTELLGAHIYRCDQCGHELALNNSCRNRHCPLCQGAARMAWVEDRLADVLPVGYFHVVCTIQEQLRPIFLRNQRVCYRLLFRAVSETLRQLCADPRRLGGQGGFIMVLHTWGQSLVYHPHIHCIVAGGVWNNDRRQWISASEQYLFPAAVVKKLFAGKLLAFVREAIGCGEIAWNGQLAQYQDPRQLKKLFDTLYATAPVVYLKEPFASPEQLIKYLGNYTHRVAISEKRIVSFDDESVSFRYKDYADGNKEKVMSVSVVEFIRRFLMHVVPSGFMRIRHYGFLANRHKKRLLADIRYSLLRMTRKLFVQPSAQSAFARMKEAIFRCPLCGKGRMQLCGETPPVWSLVAS